MIIKGSAVWDKRRADANKKEEADRAKKLKEAKKEG